MLIFNHTQGSQQFHAHPYTLRDSSPDHRPQEHRIPLHFHPGGEIRPATGRFDKRDRNQNFNGDDHQSCNVGSRI